MPVRPLPGTGAPRTGTQITTIVISSALLLGGTSAALADTQPPSIESANNEAVALVQHYRTAFRCLSGAEEEYCQELLESISTDRVANNWCERDDDCTMFEQLPFGQVPHRVDSARSLRFKMRRFQEHCEVCAVRAYAGPDATTVENSICRQGRCWIEIGPTRCDEGLDDSLPSPFDELFAPDSAEADLGESVLSDDELAAAIESLVAAHGVDERRCKQPRSPRQVWKSTCDVEFPQENRRLRASCSSLTEKESLIMTMEAALADLTVVRVMDHARPECDRRDSPTFVIVAACAGTACATVDANWTANGPEPGSVVQFFVDTADAGEQIATHLRHLIRRATDARAGQSDIEATPG